MPAYDVGYLDRVTGHRPTQISRLLSPEAAHEGWPLWLPLWAYHHEGLVLRRTLELYQAIIGQDGEAAEAWFRKRHVFVTPAWARSDVGCERLWVWQRASGRRYAWYTLAPRDEPDRFWYDCWCELELRMNDYLPLIRLELAVERLTDIRNIEAWRPSTRFEAHTLLGMIYAELLTIVTEKRLLLHCASCRQMFAPQDRRQRYCSTTCATRERVRRHRAARKHSG